MKSQLTYRAKIWLLEVLVSLPDTPKTFATNIESLITDLKIKILKLIKTFMYTFNMSVASVEHCTKMIYVDVT